MKFFKTRVRNFSTKAETTETVLLMVALAIFTFAFPLVTKDWQLFNQQLVMGSAVNAVLIIVGINSRGLSRMSAAVFMPSIAHIVNFYLFSVGSLQSLYLLPAIWIGNVIIVLTFKYLYTNKKKNFVITAVIAVALKSVTIFGIYTLAAPAMAVSMGLTQILVGLIGASISFIFVSTLYNKNKANY